MKSLAPWLLACALVVGLVLTVRDTSYARAEARRWRVTADSLAKVTRKVDTIYRRDTLRLTRWRDSLVTLRESLTVTDTVEVVRFIAVQDSTIRACSVALQTCEERVALRDSRIEALEGQLRATAAQRPTFLHKVKVAGVWLGVGYLAGRLDVP